MFGVPENTTKKASDGGAGDIELPKVTPWTQPETLQHEKEVLGIHVSVHPLDAHDKELEAWCSDSVMSLRDKSDGKEVEVEGEEKVEKANKGGERKEEEREGERETNPNIQMLNKAILLYTLTCTIGSKVNCLSYMTSIWVLW